MEPGHETLHQAVLPLEIRKEDGTEMERSVGYSWVLSDPYHSNIFVYDSTKSFACTIYLILISVTQVQMIYSHLE